MILKLFFAIDMFILSLILIIKLFLRNEAILSVDTIVSTSFVPLLKDSNYIANEIKLKTIFRVEL